MAKYQVSVPLVVKNSTSEITFKSTRELFGWLVRNPKAKVGADKNNNWFIEVRQ
jgi:hypothetical protein|nr:MAG TPA: hypothetical protein [Caudoviricetes sp.]